MLYLRPVSLFFVIVADDYDSAIECRINENDDVQKRFVVFLIFIAYDGDQHAQTSGARYSYSISVRLTNAGIVAQRLYISSTFYSTCLGLELGFVGIHDEDGFGSGLRLKV